MLAMPDTFLSRKRLAVAEWPSNKWLSAVANPNTASCFDQPIIMPAHWQGALSNPVTYGWNPRVGYPFIFAAGKGLDPGTPIEFQVTYNYAIYGVPTYQTGARGADDTSVGNDRVQNVISNGMVSLTQPVVASLGARESSKGVASVVKAEQASGAMPTGKGAIGSIIDGVKTAVPIIEGVTGTSIGEIIGDVVAGIGALLL